jgi:hypothetical protein
MSKVTESNDARSPGRQAGAASPIFIHSLFRSGSTYLFNVFRRSSGGYWCYQEPLHEALLKAREDPGLLVQTHRDLAERLRHPKLEKPYWWELNEVRESWQGLLEKSFIFDDAFGADPAACDALDRYLGALIGASRGRPLIEECRTFARIPMIRERNGGLHLYLWRNPWDQWWSYKVDPYFEVTSQLILNATAVPPVFDALRAQLGFVPIRDASVEAEIGHFWNRPLAPADSYALFFTLWCFALLEARAHADLLVNADHLSSSPGYRAEVLERFQARDIDSVQFEDCDIHRAYFAGRDLRFFEPIESRIYDLLLEQGYAREALDYLVETRRRFAPKGRHQDLSYTAAARRMRRDGERARATVLERESSLVEARARALELEYASKVTREQHGRLETSLSAARKSLSELERDRASLREALHEHTAALARSREDHDKATQELTEVRSELSAALDSLSELERDCASLREVLHEHTAALARSREDHDKAAQELIEVRSELSAALDEALRLRADLALVRSDLDSARSQVRVTGAELAHVQRVADGLSLELVRAGEETERWRADAESLERGLAEVYASTSWRVSAPLRWLKTRLGRAS